MGDVQVKIEASELKVGDWVCFGRETLKVSHLYPRPHDILIRFADDTVMYRRPDAGIVVERLS